MKIRVYYEDTDTGGIVYHSNYLNFCERARSEVFFESGVSPDHNGFAFVVKRIEADFIKSAKLGDILDVESSLISQKKVSLKVEQKVLKEGELLYKQIVEVVCLKDGKIVKIPDIYLDILTKL